MKPSRIAIIPARGGSKRIPRKNIKPFCGKPMIAWSIAAARASQCFDEILVSTDDFEIAEIARQYGANVPFIRPESLSDDFTGTIPVVRHAIEWLQDQGNTIDVACCIYATAPFIQPSDLTHGLEKLMKEECDFAFSITSYPFPIQRALRQTDEGRVQMFNPDLFETRSQDLEEAWHDAGQFYWGTTESWLEGRRIFDVGSVGVSIPRHRSQDIDTLEDWERAEWLFKALLEAEPSSGVS
ncbi:pseudaminic acid cytidylyltransferase [Saccharospirillum salsuginis]|uniref:Pseudaminic acid cytidylyltransferase n=1 Tax=Saccharospirillum salsuginis TaxID=418750 RepID=A0A918KED4_9GAMM|nr:pseudaminic acid cytidylyltransferase [Saccharospirillum salsuginis]GGX60288.1 pseudaminic acid cytidylyltransferase [Saccharospirillum salsuginis]